jgi:hypothetical protein
MLSRLRGCSCQPVKRPPLLMCDRQDKDMVLVFLKCNDVWKSFDVSFANSDRSVLCADPPWKRFRRRDSSQQSRIDRGDEFLSQGLSPLFIPQRTRAKLGTRFRMKFDPHAFARVPSGSPYGPCSRQRSERVPPRHLAIDAPTPLPMLRQLRRLALPNWKALLRRLAPDRHEAVAVLQQGFLQ